MKKNTLSKSKIAFVVIFLGLFLVLNFSQAALVNCGGHNADGTAQTSCTIPDLIKTVVSLINFLLSWAWLVATLFIVWAGWEMVNSGGNEEAVVKAKAGLSNAIIGFCLVMLAFLLLNFIMVVLTGGFEKNATTPDILKSIFDGLKLIP